MLMSSKNLSSAIRKHPLVTLEEALEFPDPLCANVALNYLIHTKKLISALEKNATVVGVALRQLYTNDAGKPAFWPSYDHYIYRLAMQIKTRLSVKKAEKNQVVKGPLQRLFRESYWKDDWEMAATFILQRRIGPACITKAASIALQQGHINCLKLLSGYMPDAACHEDLVSAARHHVRCYVFASNMVSHNSINYLRHPAQRSRFDVSEFLSDNHIMQCNWKIYLNRVNRLAKNTNEENRDFVVSMLSVLNYSENEKTNELITQLGTMSFDNTEKVRALIIQIGERIYISKYSCDRVIFSMY